MEQVCSDENWDIVMETSVAFEGVLNETRTDFAASFILFYSILFFSCIFFLFLFFCFQENPSLRQRAAASSPIIASAVALFLSFVFL